jgi:serine/threonine protein kinase
LSTHLHRTGDLFIDRYKILNYVDEGGMQQVYAATDLAFNRKVALKVPKNPSAEKRFARSARMSAKVIHANVAKTLDYFEIAGRSYLIEEFIEGTHLRKQLDSKFEYMDPHLAAHLIHNVVKGVAASHHVKVFHRDLKPHNIMVSADAGLTAIKITDFGIAKLAEEEFAEALKDGQDSITSSQTVLGALPYMAPELIEKSSGGLPADIWAVGAILYHLLDGKPPFGVGLKAVASILEAKLPSKPDLLTRKIQFRSLGEGLWHTIALCLQRDPSSRPSADKLAEICASFCYSDAERLDGEIVEYRKGKGDWGSIQAANGKKIFFHADSFYGLKPKENMKVSFSAFTGYPRDRAFPVLPLKS